MADVTMWQDKKVRAEFEAKARARLEELRAELADQVGVVAIEPESGEYFVGATLGKADAAAYDKYPDIWVYFARLDNLEAAIALPTW
jgi:glutathione S-transferase